jgi:hypothetical protein
VRRPLPIFGPVAVLLWAVSPATAIAEPPGSDTAGVTLTIVPAETSIYVGDPLLVKGVLQNRGKTPVMLARPFDAPWGGVRFEVCPPRQTTFARAYAIGEGGKCGHSRGVKVADGASIVCYEQLFWKNSEPIFSALGKWQLRMSVTIDEDVIHSQAVTISVALPAEKMRKALRENEEALAVCLAFSRGAPDEYFKRALEAQDALVGSSAARAIEQTRVLRELYNASSAKARQFALDAVKKHRDDLGPVAREYFDLLTAEILCEQKQYPAAKKIIDGLPERSHRREAIQYSSPTDFFGKDK